MKNLYSQQREARATEFNKLINKQGNNPFMLFPIRLETRFRTVDDSKNDAMFSYNDYISVLEEIGKFQDDIVTKINTEEEVAVVGKSFYQKIHNIQKRIEQLDVLPDVLKHDLYKLTRQIFSFENLCCIKTDKFFRNKIVKKGNYIKNSFGDINVEPVSKRAGNLIEALKKIDKDLSIISDFDRTSYRAISQLEKLKLPLESVVDRNDVIISNLKVKVKGNPTSNKTQFYLNIGKRKFLLDSKNASFSPKTETYAFVIPTSDFILDDLVNSMIYLSLGTAVQWRPKSINIYYTSKNVKVHYLYKDKIKWPGYQNNEDEIIKLQKESGANPRLKKYLYKKIHTLPTKMQVVFNQLYVGVNLSSYEKQKVDNLINNIIDHASQVRNNITNIYNPKHLEPIGQLHGRRPHVNVPERIKKLAKSVDGVKEYLELHQDALTVFYDVHCHKYIKRTVSIGQDINQKKLTSKYLITEDVLPASLIAEAIRINMYFELLRKGIKTVNEKALISVLSDTALERLGFGNYNIIFNSLEEYHLLDKQIKKLKNNWSVLIVEMSGTSLGIALEKGFWTESLPDSLPKKIAGTGITSNKQLCVRIFPDDIFISQFRKPLDKEEYADAKNFHILWFIFSGNRILVRSLWDSLVNKYGVHRASWLVRVFSKHMKKNIVKRPYNNFADSYLDEITNILNQLNQQKKGRDEILKLLESCSTSLYNMRNKVYDYKYIPDVLYDQIQSKIERVKQSFSFYERLYEVVDPSLQEVDPREMELWDKDYYAVLNFKSELDDFLSHLKGNSNSKGKRRSLSKIKGDFEEKYFGDTYFKTRDGISGRNDLLELSDDDYEPCSPILPDRFVFIGEWSNGENSDTITEYGRKVNPNLQLSFSDNDEEELDPYLLSIAKGDVEVAGGLKWLFDYDEAVRNGMAITVPLSDEMYDATFKSIYVFGVKKTHSGKQTLEDLLYSHIYTENSLDFLEVGTPTNQLESNRRHYKYLREQAQIDRRYEIEVSRYKTNDQNEFVDGLSVGTASKNLASVLGLNRDNNGGAFAYLNSCDLNQSSLSIEAIKYFLPDNENLNDEKLKEFFKKLSGDINNPGYISKYVFPRGFLPTIRVDDMPYGIMPVTDFKNLSISEDTNVENLYELLNNLSVHWDNMFNKKVEDIESLQNEKDEDSQVRFMRMMSANPHSVSHRRLKMLKHALLAKQFHFYGKYKNLDAESLANYSSMLTPEMLENFDAFSYFSTGEISSNAVDINEIAEKLNIKTTELIDLIDLFSYRLDAWFMSLANYQLKKKNAKNVYIGAYGWLFNLKRNKGQNARTQLSASKQKEVVEDLKLKDTTSPIYEDRNSEGIMLAPSISHAVTAAVMHSAFARSKKNNQQSNQQDNRLSINLSSGRMQRAMQVIDGVSNGLSVGAILGANLERGLHEAYKILGVEMDEFIYSLRQKYPLNIDSYSIDASDSNAQSMQGLNGASLLEDIFEKTKWYNNRTTTPLSELIEKNKNINDIAGKTFVGNQKRVFAGLVEQIADTYDAVNDLILSEGVYQLVKGNRTALSALMNKMENNSLIARPEILDIPMRSVNISHRLVVNFSTFANQELEGWTSSSVYSSAEPSLNHFAGNLLGNGENIGIWIKTKGEKVTFVSLNDLEVAPLDYLYFSSNQFAFIEMLLAKYRVVENYWLPELEQVEAPADKDEKICITEQTLFVESLRKMVQTGMQLKASHFVHQSEQNETADTAEYYNLENLLGRLQTVIDHISAVRASLEAKLLEIKNALVLKDTNPSENKGLIVLLDKTAISQMSVNQFKELIPLLTKAYTCGVIESVPPTEVFFAQEIVEGADLDKDKLEKLVKNIYTNKKAIVEQALDTLQALDNKLKQKTQFEALKTQWDEKDKYPDFDVLGFINECNQIAEKLLVKNFKLLPHLNLSKLNNDAKEQLRNQLTNNQYINALPHQMEEWLMDLAKVRKHVKDLHSVRINAICTTDVKPLTPVQLPFNEDTEWAGMEFSDEEKLDDKESTVLWDADALKNSLTNDVCVGFVVDAWIELIPKRRQNAGAVFHYDVPNAEPPQTILLAVSPDSEGNWSKEQLVRILNETKRMAGYRLVEPEMINDNKTLSRILPFTSFIQKPRILVPCTPDKEEEAKQKPRILVLCTPDKEEEAKNAGADYVGLHDYIEKIKEGWVDFDVVITMPSIIPKVGALGRILGPLGLMPTLESGRITNNIGEAVLREKRLEY